MTSPSPADRLLKLMQMRSIRHEQVAMQLGWTVEQLSMYLSKGQQHALIAPKVCDSISMVTRSVTRMWCRWKTQWKSYYNATKSYKLHTLWNGRPQYHLRRLQWQCGALMQHHRWVHYFFLSWYWLSHLNFQACTILYWPSYYSSVIRIGSTAPSSETTTRCISSAIDDCCITSYSSI